MENKTDTLVEEKKDDKVEDLSQPENTGKKTNPPVNASDSKGLDELLAEKTKAYSESSKEAKRLAAENKAIKEATEDYKKQVEELNDYIDVLEESKEESKEDKATVEPEVEKPEVKQAPVRPSTEPTSAMEKIDYDKKWKENYEKEKAVEREANKEMEEAIKKYPGMAKKSYSKRVSEKMAAKGIGILDACKKVDSDIEEERKELEGGAPFTESGSGAKNSQVSTKNDPIIDHLISGSSRNGGLEGL